jgi:hypothetical protein
MLPPNLFPQTGGAVIEGLNLLGEGVGHSTAGFLGNEGVDYSGLKRMTVMLTALLLSGVDQGGGRRLQLGRVIIRSAIRSIA